MRGPCGWRLTKTPSKTEVIAKSAAGAPEVAATKSCERTAARTTGGVKTGYNVISGPKETAVVMEIKIVHRFFHNLSADSIARVQAMPLRF